MTAIVDAIERRFRNPSIKFVVALLLGVIVILGGILGPTVIKDGVENLREIKRVQEFEFAGPIETWIRPWIVQQAETMINAENPLQWRVHSFQLGPCSPGNLKLLPNADLRDIIDQSCRDLSQIQISHGNECFLADTCAITESTKNEIRVVIANIDAVFSELGLVVPYESNEQPSQ